MIRWRELNPRRAIFRAKLDNALRGGVPFSVAFEEVVWPERCPVLGTILDYTLGVGQKDARVTPSFDRIDPTRGYESGNIIIISKHANTIKNNATAAEVRAVADWMDSLTRAK